jgi:predicted ester cyclase
MGADTDLLRRLTSEVFGKRNLDALDDLLSEDFVSHDPPRGFAATRDGFRGLTKMVIAAYGDGRKLEFEEILETTDGRVVTSWAMVGNHTGDAFGLVPSGQPVRVRGIEIWRCADGKIVEHWASIDISDVLIKAQLHRSDSEGMSR